MFFAEIANLTDSLVVSNQKEFRTATLTLLAILPILGLGVWLIISESLISSVTRRSLLEVGRGPTHNKWRAVSRKAIQTSPWNFSIFAALFALASSALLLFWFYSKQILLWAIAIAVLLVHRNINREKRAAEQHIRVVESEMPQIVQLISILVSSGISPLKSLEIISQRSTSKLSEEFRTVVSDMNCGRSAPEALDGLMFRVEAPGIRRFTTNLLVAMERGAPLVPILVSLVHDFHSESKVTMMRQAGRAEIALMVPVVFLLLPISVLFTLFPSMLQLQLFFN
jgi:tight adherence protein C